VIVSEGVGWWANFLNPSCGIEEFWKTMFALPLSDPGFPLLPQACKKGLCKAEDLCEKCVLSRWRIGFLGGWSSTNDSSPSAMKELSDQRLWFKSQ
jgi:hypothetical protein